MVHFYAFHKLHFKKFLSAFLAVMISVGFLLPSDSFLKASAASIEQLVRVGLYFGSSAKTSFNLSSHSGYGNGFQAGYYNGDTFVSVGQIACEDITVAIDSNLYYDGNAYYAGTSSGTLTVGGWHVQMKDSYSSFSEASSAATAAGGFVCWSDGSYYVRKGSYTSLASAQTAASSITGATAVGSSSSAVTVLKQGTTYILFEFDSSTMSFALQPYSDSGVKTETYTTGGYMYYGSFSFPRGSGSLSLINVVDIDDYTACVTPYEMVSSWPLETLKAGAICARTFAEVTTKHSSYGINVCTTTCCQVYRGIYTTSEEGRQNCEQAAYDTSGQCVYYNGKLASSLMYFSSDGGATESAVNYGGTDVPYMIGKADPYDYNSKNPTYNWSYTVTSAQLTSWLKSLGYSCSTIVSAGVTEWTDTGNVNEITFTDSSGKKYTLTRDKTRTLSKACTSVHYFSRHYCIVPSGVTPVYSSAAAASAVSDTSGSSYGSYSVISSSGISSSGTLYAIDSDGKKYQIQDGATVITESGTEILSEDSDGQAAAETEDTTVSDAANLDRTDYSKVKASSWTIYGSGYGHNIGMSQYGAYQMGMKGFTCEEILKFYYTGVSVY